MLAADYRKILGDGRSGEFHRILRRRRCGMRLQTGARSLRPESQQEREKQNTPHYHVVHTNYNVSLVV